MAPDAFAKVMKATNHTGLWDPELTRYSLNTTHWICRGCEGDKLHWTVRSWARWILSEYYSQDLQRSQRWQTTLDCEILSLMDTLWIQLTGFAEVAKVTNHTRYFECCLEHGFRPMWPWLIAWLQEPWQNLLNHLLTVLWSTAEPSPFI